jgi:hypothetical protein
MLEISGRDLGGRGGPCCGSHLLASVPVTGSPLSSATMTYSLPSSDTITDETTVPPAPFPTR